MTHFDLPALARRLWRIRLESRTWAMLRIIFWAFRGADEVPGYLIPEMYFEYLRTSDARPLGGVFYHNAVDILSLAGLFSHMAFLLNEPDSEDVQYAEDIVSLGRFFEAMGDHHRAEALYKKAMTEKLPAELLQDTRSRLSFLLKRKGDWNAAGALWEQAAQDQELYAFEELAKYYEHHSRDLEAAHYWASSKMVLESSSLSRSERDRWKA